MAREQWWADDWELTQALVRDVETREGLLRAPGKRGGNAEVPAAHGALWRPKKYGEGSLVLNVWLGDTTREAVEGYWDDLLRAVAPADRLVRYRRLTARGETRVAYGEVVTTVEPKPAGSNLMRCAIEVVVPSGRWVEEVDRAASTTAGAALPQTLALTALNVSTAPLDRLVVAITGPITDPTVVDRTHGVDGHSFTWRGTIAAGQTLTVDSGTWAVTGSGGLAVPHAGPLSYTGDRYLEVPQARVGGTPTVQLRGTNGGAGTRLTVTGRRTYLV